MAIIIQAITAVLFALLNGAGVLVRVLPVRVGSPAARLAGELAPPPHGRAHFSVLTFLPFQLLRSGFYALEA